MENFGVDPGFLESMGMALQQQGPRLVIANQMSLRKDSYTHDGQQKVVHNIVKLSPFTLELQLDGRRYVNHKRIDFNSVVIDASLVFDDGAFEKEVPYVRHKPIEYHGRVSSVDADFMSLDIKIGVLTSHCENSLFRVKLRGVDAHTGERLPDLVAISEPIKVISKPDGLHRQKKPPVRRARGTKRTRTEADAQNDNVATGAAQQQSGPLAALDEGTNQTLVGMLSRIVDEQREHRKILDCLVTEARARAKNAELDAGFFPSPTGDKMDVAAPDLETSFRLFVDAYLKTDPAQRPLKIRKIVESNPVKTNEAFAEMIDRFLAEGVRAQVNAKLPSSSACGPANEREGLDLSSSGLPSADLAALLPLSLDRSGSGKRDRVMARSDSADLFAGYDAASNSPFGELTSFFN